MAAPSIVARLGLDTGDFKRGIADAKKEASEFSTALKGGLAAVGGFLGAQAMADFAKSAVDASAKVETLGTSFEVMTGNAQTASTLMGDIMGLANSTPFQTDELAAAGKSLLAFNTTAAEVVPTLRRIGDISSGIGAPVGEIAEIFGKAKVQGRLFAEDINQLTGRGIPVIQEFAKQFGTTDDKVKGLVETGKIGFEQLEKAFVSLTSEGGKFFNMTQKQADTTAGKLSTLADAWEGFKRALVDTSLVKGGAGGLTETIGGMTAVAEVLLGSGKGIGDNQEKSLAWRLSQFLNPHSGGLGTTQGRKEFEEAKARQEQFLKDKAEAEEKARKEKAEKEKAELDALDELQRKQFVEFDAAKQKAEAEAAERRKRDLDDIYKYEEQLFDGMLDRFKKEREKQAEQEKQDIESKEEQERQQYVDFQKEKEEDQKRREDKFVEDQLAGPDSRREAGRRARRERQLRARFKRLEELDDRDGHAKQDIQDNMAPFKRRGGGDNAQPVQPGQQDPGTKLDLINTSLQTILTAVTGLNFVTPPGGKR